MNLRSGKVRYGLLAAIAAAALLLWPFLQRAVFSVRLARSLQTMASGAAVSSESVREMTVTRQLRGADYKALVFLPKDSEARTAIVIAAGLSEQGCYHPRLVALSRSLAKLGLMVITPDIREFREFEISAEPISQILFWFRQVPGLEGGGKVRTTGLAGISYSGTLALITAAQPEIRGKVGFVAAIGPYSSLLRCNRNWFAAAPGSASANYPTRFYAKWLVMLSALEMVAEPADRAFLRKTIMSLLLRGQAPPPDPNLGADGRRWYQLAAMRANQSDDDLARKIERYLVPRLFSRLEPEASLAKIDCPVFLIHGAHDDLIPPGESIELHRKLAHAHLLISPFLTHTHPADAPIPRSRRIAAALEGLAFFYRLSGVVL